MTKWCQNPNCADKKSSGQIRGNKGNKWYQSNRVGSYSYGGSNFVRYNAIMNGRKSICPKQ